MLIWQRKKKHPKNRDNHKNSDMANAENDLLMLESIIGAPASRSAGVQVGVDSNLPIKFPQSSIHYELYRNHIELHVESSSYGYLCSYLEKHLPQNEIAQTEKRSFCQYAYSLNREVVGWRNIQELGDAIVELRKIVEPVLLQYCEQIAENAELASVLGKYYEEQKEALPYHINVIDELHANENAHTRILLQLLKYKEIGKRVILSSFIKLLPGFDSESVDIDKAQIDFNRDFIDGLIERDKEYAIIIENKIHWAVDQDKQIERYVETEINRGIPADKIWVVYLTRDGQKKVESYSLTKKTKDILAERFVEMDYCHHILPWLKEKILPNCRLKEEWLVSAIKQYVDHLEGLFDLRDSSKGLLNKVQGKISEAIGITSNMTRVEVYSRLRLYQKTLGDLQNMVSNSLDGMIDPHVERFRKTTMDILTDMLPNEQIETNNVVGNGYYQVLFSKWPSAIHFEWIPLKKRQILSATEYTIVLHVERGDLQENFIRCLNDETLNGRATALSLEENHNDKRVFYKKVIKTQRAISDMTSDEMYSFLREAYKDVNGIYKFVSEHVLSSEIE